jgi:hypothetical protein
MKTGYVNTGFVSFQYKIPTNINQNTVIKLQKITYFWNNFWRIFVIFSYIYIYINNTKYNIYNIIYNIKWAGLVRPNRLGRTQPKIVGPISAQNGLGRSRPKILIFSSGPDPAQKTGLGQDPPGPDSKRAGGINFPPPLHAERYSFCMQRRK